MNTLSSSSRFYDNGTINFSELVIPFLIFLIVPPVISLPYLIFYFWGTTKINKSGYVLFFFCIAAYIASIHATKYPSGDQINYYIAYKNVPRAGLVGSMKYIYGFTFGDPSITTISGEFMNGIYNFIGYYITFGYYPLFEFILTFIDYLLIFFGLYHYSRNFPKPHHSLISGVIIISFFFLFFALTLQIQKQIVAQCIMTYVLGSYANSGKMTKRLWTIAFIAVCTHASTSLFLPLLYFGFIRQGLTKKGMIAMGGLLSVFILVGPVIAGSLVADHSSVATYGLSRLAQAESQDDGLGIQIQQIVLVGLPLMLICLKKICFERKTLNNSTAFMLNICMLLLLAVISMFKQPLAQYRYFMMLYIFIPYIFPFALNNIRLRDMFLKSVSIFMIVTFFLHYDDLQGKYAPLIDTLIKGPLFLVFGNYQNFN